MGHGTAADADPSASGNLRLERASRGQIRFPAFENRTCSACQLTCCLARDYGDRLRGLADGNSLKSNRLRRHHPKDVPKTGSDPGTSFRAISASNGTKDCACRAIEAELPTYRIDSDAGVPKRMLAGDARLR